MHIRRIALHPERYPVDDRYPFSLPLFRETRSIELASPVTLFVGENGTGKSTLLEAVARRCGIHIWENEEGPRLEWNRYEHSLHQYLDVDWVNGRVPGSFFAARIFRSYAEMVETVSAGNPGQLRHYGGRSLISQSHGESLLSFFAARYCIRGLYLLDEPETALSPRSQVRLVEILRQAAAAGHAQFLLCTHSPILLACPGAAIHTFDACPIRPVAYEETDHYRLYRDFMADPAGHLAAARQGSAPEQANPRPCPHRTNPGE